MMPHASPSVPISSEQAHTPVEKHAVQAPGAEGLQPARHRPATQVRPSAHCVPLQAWHVVGALDPGRHTLDAPDDSAAQVLPEPQVASGHALQNPP